MLTGTNVNENQQIPHRRRDSKHGGLLMAVLFCREKGIPQTRRKGGKSCNGTFGTSGEKRPSEAALSDKALVGRRGDRGEGTATTDLLHPECPAPRPLFGVTAAPSPRRRQGMVRAWSGQPAPLELTRSWEERTVGVGLGQRPLCYVLRGHQQLLNAQGTRPLPRDGGTACGGDGQEAHTRHQGSEGQAGWGALAFTGVPNRA